MSKKKKQFPVKTTTIIKNPLAIPGKFETNTTLQLALIILFPVIIYIKIVHFRFVNFDDTGIITDHFDILGNIHKIGEAFRRDAFLSAKGDSFYRPVQSISFMLDALVGSKNSWVYHLDNLIIHLLTCISL